MSKVLAVSKVFLFLKRQRMKNIIALFAAVVVYATHSINWGAQPMEKLVLDSHTCLLSIRQPWRD